MSTLNAITSGAGGVALSGDTSGNLIIQSAGTNVMSVTTGSLVGIGTTAPSAKLHVSQVGNPVAQFTRSDSGTGLVIASDSTGPYFRPETNSEIRFNNSANTVQNMTVRTDGRVLIVGTSVNSGSTTAGLEVTVPNATNGQYGFAIINSAATSYGIAYRNDGYFRSEAAYAQTTGSSPNLFVDSSGYVLRSTSSQKYKTDIQNSTHGLNDLLKLRAVTYKQKNADADGNEVKTVFGGLIAEEVDEAGLAEFVQYAEDGSPDALAYGNMVSLCIKAIQELNAKVDAQAAEIAALKGA